MNSVDLGSSLLQLTAGVQATMNIVQTLSNRKLNTKHTAVEVEELNILRSILKDHWKEILKILKECYDAIDSLLVLIRAIGEESDQECMTFLEEVMPFITTIMEHLRAVIAQDSEISQKLVEVTGIDFMDDNSGDGGDDSVTIYLSDISRPSVKPELSPESTDSVHPNLDYFSTSLIFPDTKRNLEAILEFWIVLHAECQSVQKSPPLTRKDLKEKCNGCATLWQADREYIQGAVASLNRFLETIMPEVIASPVPQISSSSLPSPSRWKILPVHISFAPISTLTSLAASLIKSHSDVPVSPSLLPSQSSPDMLAPAMRTSTLEPENEREERPLPPLPSSGSGLSKVEALRDKALQSWKELLSNFRSNRMPNGSEGTRL